MIASGSYDPVKDLKPVDQIGFIDLPRAFVNGTIPPGIAEGDEAYNGIENPRSILGKPRDVFDALSLNQSIQDYKPGKDTKD